jgi:hypothetical protein
MAENLKTTRYSDGAVIPLVTDGGSWSTAGTNGDPAYSYYDNSTSNLITYEYFIIGILFMLEQTEIRMCVLRIGMFLQMENGPH